MDAAQIDDSLHTWARSPEAAWLSPGILRRARKVPQLQAALDGLLERPSWRALAGLEPGAPAPGDASEDDLWFAVAALDAGRAPAPDQARALAAAHAEDPELCVPALRLWVWTDPARENRARAALSEQDLPYVFPGELHPLSIELLASADRVMTALHVDWMRKLTGWSADALPADARARGFWFWPHLRFLDEKRLAGPLRKLGRIRRAPPGAQGMALAYQHRIGMDVQRAFDRAAPAERFVCAVGVASDRARAGTGG